MATLVFLIVFFMVIAISWFAGLWSNMLTLVNLVFAGLFATNFYEPVSNLVEQQSAPFTYLIDFIVVWALFAISFLMLRLITDSLSRIRVKFNIWVEMAGRSILSIWIAWVFVCFSYFTLHMAPLPADAIQATPQSAPFLGMGADRVWLSFAQSRSRGALSRGHFQGTSHPDDESKNVQTFDPQSDFVFKYHNRRVQFSRLDDFRVAP